MIATLVRTVAFFPFACAFWALLPLIAASQMRDGAAVYGVLMGVIGVGSIVGSFGLNRWKTEFGPDRLAAGATGRNDPGAPPVRRRARARRWRSWRASSAARPGS